MNELQKVLREILGEYVRVCRELNLCYYLVCGSALGAVKYRGFIPWDDDVDVGMPREDYERFLREAPALLPEYLVLQNYHTEPVSAHIYTKLRDSRTTCIENTCKNLPIHHGVFMDIFPLDGYPEGALARTVLELRKWHYKGQLACVYDIPRSGVTKLRCALFRGLGCHRRTAAIAARYDRMISRYPVADSRLICNHGNWQGSREYAPAEQYGQGAPARFEGLCVTVPEGFDSYLRQKYGDYRLDPPAQKQKSHHDFAVLDCSRSYTHYTKNQSTKEERK